MRPAKAPPARLRPATARAPQVAFEATDDRGDVRDDLAVLCELEAARRRAAGVRADAGKLRAPVIRALIRAARAASGR